MSDKFLIEKRGLYYRPNANGYTGLKREAGRYSFEDAVERIGPNGPDGPQNGRGIWREDEAPEFSSACAWDIKHNQHMEKGTAMPTSSSDAGVTAQHMTPIPARLTALNTTAQTMTLALADGIAEFGPIAEAEGWTAREACEHLAALMRESAR